PDPNDDAIASDLVTLAYWADRQDVRDRFWRNHLSPLRKLVNSAFAEYRAWAEKRCGANSRLHVRWGLLPGDLSATFEKEGVKIGILGLNTAFLQLQGGDYQGKLAVDYRQFDEACGKRGPDWAGEHHLCLLLTHHPRDWLGQAAKEDLGRIV